MSGLGNIVNIAVEVKHKKTVGIPEISRSLDANRHYPQIMRTSGTFSSKVIEEKRTDERYLRLILKDNIALRQLIKGYGRKA
jgi:hypothetical protein